ncbi:amidohydrolase [Desulfobacterota bacterium AH_259_B03_O07]|nr:amidohydrolase [Desulfobacterota bacterium AH_259_B03_O07]
MNDIYNCHVHTFTIDHVPKNFIGHGVDRLLRIKRIRRSVFFLMKHLNPFADNDLLDRYVRFLEIASKPSQEVIFKKVQSYYEPLFDAKYIVLPMDMKYMDAGDPQDDIDKQHLELAKLSKDPEYEGKIIPFVGLDPRRGSDELLTMTKNLVENEGFRGLKIYPPLGYFPFDKALKPVYKYAEQKGIPVMTHCSRGGVYKKKVTRDMLINHPITGEPLRKKKAKYFTDYYTDPNNYVPILEGFPNLRICLGHFGGDQEWEKYFSRPVESDPEKEEKSWFEIIRDMIKSGKYPNLYADISYTIVSANDAIEILDFLMDDQVLAERILYGTDFYMIEREKFKERRLPIRLRSYLGKEKFDLLTVDNPKRYLGIS